MSTPQTSVWLLERACCRIWRTTSLSTTRAGCAFDGFALAFMIPELQELFAPKKADPEPVAHLRAECMRSPAHRRARRKRQAAAAPTGSAACHPAPPRPNTNATKPLFAVARPWDILPAQTEHSPLPDTVLLLRGMQDKQTFAPHRD